MPRPGRRKGRVATWQLGTGQLRAHRRAAAAGGGGGRRAGRAAGGEPVVDVGCGTGNAALLAAERGAPVTGVDPAQRLIDVAAATAERARAGRGVRRRRGGLAARSKTTSADVVLSVFGVIFAPDPQAAAAEIAQSDGAGRPDPDRRLDPGGTRSPGRSAITRRDDGRDHRPAAEPRRRSPGTSAERWRSCSTPTASIGRAHRAHDRLRGALRPTSSCESEAENHPHRGSRPGPLLEEAGRVEELRATACSDLRERPTRTRTASGSPAATWSPRSAAVAGERCRSGRRCGRS